MSCSVRVPATSANLGPGFDSFGLALQLYNQFVFSPAECDSVSVDPASSVSVEGLQGAPCDNLAFQALESLYQELGQTRPRLALRITAQIPLARGLGSSSTAIVAGLVAGAALSGESFSRHALMQRAAAMEGHPDNVAPAIMGGVTLCDERGTGEFDCYALPWPSEWRLMAMVPADRLLTEAGRQVLPAGYSRADAVFNLRKASLLTYSLLQADPEALVASLNDRLHQPYRGPLIREFHPLSALAREAGAFGVVISGSGSSLLAFYPHGVETALRTSLEAYRQSESPRLRLLPLGLDTEGARLLASQDFLGKNTTPPPGRAKA